MFLFLIHIFCFFINIVASFCEMSKLKDCQKIRYKLYMFQDLISPIFFNLTYSTFVCLFVCLFRVRKESQEVKELKDNVVIEVILEHVDLMDQMEY